MARVSGTHEDESMPIGLQKRGSTYWLRRRVPKDLIEAYGRAEVTKSLGTKELAEAKRRLAVETVALDNEWMALRTSLKSPLVDGAAAASPSRLGKLRGGRDAPPSLLDSITKLALSDRLRRPVEEGGTSNIADVWGDRRATAFSGKPITWDALVDKWAAERKPTAKTQKAHRAVAKEFVEAVGDIPLGELTRRHGLAFKDHLVEDLTENLSAKTKLSRLRTLVNFGFENDLLAVRFMDGVRAPKSKSVGRRPYSDEALQKLFQGPVHTKGQRPAQGRGEASYWLPLIAAYSGARLEEIAGLRVSDVVQLDLGAGADGETGWFFRFVPVLEANRRLKTEHSERETPVHPELIRLGLIRYARSVAESGEAQLFPRLTAQASGQRASKWGEWFSRYRRQDCGINDPSIDFHSFRHTFKDAALECGMPERLQRQIMGHSAKGVADSYGSGYSRRAAHDWISRVRLLGMPRLTAAQ